MRMPYLAMVVFEFFSLLHLFNSLEGTGQVGRNFLRDLGSSQGLGMWLSW